MKSFDAAVIGAGPAGLTAALYLCRSGLKTALLEKFSPGGQMLLTAGIENYPGFPNGISGFDLADNFSAHLEAYEVERLSQEVLTISRGDKNFLLKLDSESIEARVIIICSGASPKKLGIKDEERLTGHGISYCAMCDGMFFKGKDVVMVGGGNSALEEALYLSNIVRKLYLVHRRDSFRADKIYQEKIAARSDIIEPMPGYVVSELHGENSLSWVKVSSVSGGHDHLLKVSGLFIFVGHNPVGNFLPPEIKKDDAGFIITDAEMRTSVPGIFAAGDIRSKLCRQVATAIGDGATAAHAAFIYLEANGN